MLTWFLNQRQSQKNPINNFAFKKIAKIVKNSDKSKWSYFN